MLSRLGCLWRGELPLADAFWTWAVFGGLLVNLPTTAAKWILLASQETAAALVVGYALPVPFNVLVALGVWRASAHYEGPAHWAILARAAAIVGLGLLSVF